MPIDPLLLEVALNDELRYTIRDWLMAELDIGDPGPKLPALNRVEADPDPGVTMKVQAIVEWQSIVTEPPGPGADRIDSYIRGDFGLGWPTADAVNWTPDHAYDRDGIFQWCGAFAAWCAGHAGLKASIRREHLASTWRLWQFCRDTSRKLYLKDIRPGDLVIVTRGRKHHGEHIAVAIELPTDGLIETIEGNATAMIPDGTITEGVVRRTRPLPTSAGGPGRSTEKCPISGRRQTFEVAHAYRFIGDDWATEVS